MRKIKFFFQKMFRGYGDNELWSLDLTLIKFLYPRLLKFIEISKKDKGISMQYFGPELKNEPTEFEIYLAKKKEHLVLSKIKFACEWSLYDVGCLNKKQKKEFEEKYSDDYLPMGLMNEFYKIGLMNKFYKRTEEGFKLLGKYIFSLWY